jgi:chromosomal replication initiation ATPase DnaA
MKTTNLRRILVNLKALDIMELVVDAVRRHRVSLEDVFSRERRAEVSLARHHVWFELREQGWTLGRIASLFQRDHTTIINGIGAFEDAAGLMTDAAKTYRAKVAMRRAEYHDRALPTRTAAVA